MEHESRLVLASFVDFYLPIATVSVQGREYRGFHKGIYTHIHTGTRRRGVKRHVSFVANTMGAAHFVRVGSITSCQSTFSITNRSNSIAFEPGQ